MTERLDQQNLTPEDDLLSGSEIMSIHFQSQLLESLDDGRFAPRDSLLPEEDADPELIRDFRSS